MSTQTAPSEVRSTILGVTGLSRPVIAALYRSRGLFGADSQLAAAEQAVVQSRLPALPGVAAGTPPAFRSSRLKRLADYVDARLAGRDGAAEREQLIAEGLSRAAILEAALTVDNVRVVFGLPATVAAAPADTGEIARPAYARAA
jgi:hypothetical protein